MENAILLHGTCDEEEYFNEQYPSLSNSHWFPWLQKQLLMHNIIAQTPEMPNAYKPDYSKWKSEFEKQTIDENTILVGHSCGGGFLLRWLSENDLKVGNTVLVAPWLDPDRSKTTDFFDFTMNPNILNRTKSLQIFVSNDDEGDILSSVDTIEKSISGISIKRFEGKGHFTLDEMKTERFPELLEAILK